MHSASFLLSFLYDSNVLHYPTFYQLVKNGSGLSQGLFTLSLADKSQQEIIRDRLVLHFLT